MILQPAKVNEHTAVHNLAVSAVQYIVMKKKYTPFMSMPWQQASIPPAWPPILLNAQRYSANLQFTRGPFADWLGYARAIGCSLTYIGRYLIAEYRKVSLNPNLKGEVS